MTAIYLITPPMREAITELANAWADWSMNAEPGEKRGRRLLQAQDALGIELASRAALVAYLKQEAA